MIALFVIAHAYTAAVVITAGRLYILGCAYGLRKALAAAHRPPKTPARIAAEHVSSRTRQAPTPVLQWPRDN